MIAAWVLGGCSGGPADSVPPGQAQAAAAAQSAQDAYSKGRIDSAILSLRESVRLHLVAGDLPAASRSLLNLALAERAAGDAPAAAAAAARLRDLAPAAVQQAGERGGGTAQAAELTAASAWLGALLSLDRGDLAEARAGAPAPDPQLAPSSQMRGRIGTLQAAIALRAARFAEALQRAKEARAAAADAQDPSEEAHAWSLSGAAHAGQGDLTSARSDYREAIRIEERIGGGLWMAADLRRLASVSNQLGDGADARLYVQRADAIQAAWGSGR